MAEALSKPQNTSQRELFLAEIAKMDDIVPLPVGDVLDRHLVVVYIDCFGDKNNGRPPNYNESLLRRLNASVLENGELSESAMSFVRGLRPDDYRIVKIATNALSRRSDYFCSLLSHKSSFAESKEDAVRIHVHLHYGFAFEALVRLLHLRENEVVHHFRRIHSHHTLLQLLMLVDQYRINDIGHHIIAQLRSLAMTERAHSIAALADCIEDRRMMQLLSPSQLGDAAQSEAANGRESDRVLPPSNKPRAMFFRHIRSGEGGLSLFEVAQLLSVVEHFQSLSAIAEVAKEALRERVLSLDFNAFGVVEVEFRRLPPSAVVTILSGTNATNDLIGKAAGKDTKKAK